MLNFFSLFILTLMVFISSLNAYPDTSSSSTTPATTQLRVSTVNGFSAITERDGLTKRDVPVADEQRESTATGKSYDPQPEFYRDPALPTSHGVAAYSAGDQQASRLTAKPIAFPDTHERQSYEQDNRNYLAHTYNSWRQRVNPASADARGQPGQERISVGHYGSASHGDAAGGNTVRGYKNVYTYEGYPYATGVAGTGPGYEYNTHGVHYASAGHNDIGVGVGVGGVGGGGGGRGGVVYYSNPEAIPFDLYTHTSANHNNNKGQNAGAGAGVGGEYAFGEPFEYPVHKGPPNHHDYSQKALLAKSFLIPLASAAVLGIAAALVSNPLLLQLGTVAGVAPALVGKRKRRAVPKSSSRGDESVELEKKQTMRLPYRGYHPQREEDVDS